MEGRALSFEEWVEETADATCEAVSDSQRKPKPSTQVGVRHPGRATSAEAWQEQPTHQHGGDCIKSFCKFRNTLPILGVRRIVFGYKHFFPELTKSRVT